jgi:hypothetical protein
LRRDVVTLFRIGGNVIELFAVDESPAFAEDGNAVPVGWILVAVHRDDELALGPGRAGLVSQ